MIARVLEALATFIVGVKDESPESLQKQVDLAMRPFEVVLLEAVPKGEKPALDRPFADQPLPRAFSEASRRVELKALPPEQAAANQPATIHVRGQIPSTAAGGVLVMAVELRQGSHAWAPRNRRCVRCEVERRRTASGAARRSMAYPRGSSTSTSC